MFVRFPAETVTGALIAALRLPDTPLAVMGLRALFRRALFVATASVVALSPVRALALADDRDQPIEIQADWAELDERGGTATYGGKVRMSQGTLLVSADQLVIHTENEEVVRITAKGNDASPAHYEQQPRPGDPPLQANAQVITYFTREERIELAGNAELQRPDVRFRGAMIHYDMAKSLVTANGGGETSTPTGQGVSVTIDPKKRNRETADESSAALDSPPSVTP